MLDVAVRKRLGDFNLDVAFRAEGPTLTALFGRSGSGKTSVIAMVAGLLRPDDGRVAAGGRVLYDRTARIDLPPHRRRIGYVFQDSRLFPHYTVRGNLMYGMARVPAAERFIDFDQVVDLLGIGALLERRPGRLSGGERQRVAIGRALLSSPRLLLMDEPLASLDGARKAELLPFIAVLARTFRLPILYVSHAVDEVLRLADRLVLLEEGRVLACGAVESVMSRAEFAAAAGEATQISVVSGVVDRHEDDRGTTHLTFAGGELHLPRLDVAPGRQVRVCIDAGDVIIALGRPQGLSVQNTLAASITGLRPDGGMVDVLLDVGSPLRARITARACADLDLRVGGQVFALVKSASLSRADIAEYGGG